MKLNSHWVGKLPPFAVFLPSFFSFRLDIVFPTAAAAATSCSVLEKRKEKRKVRAQVLLSSSFSTLNNRKKRKGERKKIRKVCEFFLFFFLYHYYQYLLSFHPLAERPHLFLTARRRDRLLSNPDCVALPGFNDSE